MTELIEMKKKEIAKQVEQTFEMAERKFDRKFNRVPIDFSLTGKCAGQYVKYFDNHFLKFNMDMAMCNQDTYFETVVHEVAHYLARIIHGTKRIKPHGIEWKTIMLILDAEPRTRHSYKMPSSYYNKNHFKYVCKCQEFFLSKRKHEGGGINGTLQCKKCKSTLKFVCDVNDKTALTPEKIAPPVFTPAPGKKREKVSLGIVGDTFTTKDIAAEVGLDTKKVRQLLRKYESCLPARDSKKWIFNIADKDAVLKIIVIHS